MNVKRTSNAVKAALFGLAVLSPIGAPVIGMGIGLACETELGGMWQCADGSLIHYFSFWVVLPFKWFGIFGGILWMLAAAAVSIGAIWYATKAIIRPWVDGI